MLHMRQPYFSMLSALIYGLLGVLFGLSAAFGAPITLQGVELAGAIEWSITGVMFIMAYFSLVHLRID